jgi:hypothetical protein
MIAYRDMDLAAGDNTWDLTFTTGALEGPFPQESPMIGLLHRRPDGTVFLAPLQPGEDGRLNQTGLPAGPATLVTPEGEQPDPDPAKWRVVREVIVPEGGIGRVE